MKCYFLRHGLAAEPAEWRGDDFDRPLTREGRERMEREAKAIADLALGLDVIVTSPLARARQTAEIVAQRLKMGARLIEDKRLGNGLGVDRLGALLAEHAGAESLMLVGHEPSMSATIGRLAGGAGIELKKGALACVELADPSSRTGTLLWLLPPKVLSAFEKR
ncbi:MAG: phosphohistidine phosphatase SixA [Candidatus Baltobacteraceae bacterium]